MGARGVAAALLAVASGALADNVPVKKANYDLAARWTAAWPAR